MLSSSIKTEQSILLNMPCHIIETVYFLHNMNYIYVLPSLRKIESNSLSLKLAARHP